MRWKLSLSLYAALTVTILALVFVKPLRVKILEKFFATTYQRYNYFCGIPRKTPYIVAGSSVNEFGVQPAVLNKVFNLKESPFYNFAQKASTPFAVYTSLKRNEQRIKNIKVFVLSVNDWILSEGYYLYRPAERFLWTFSEYLKVLDFDFSDSYFSSYSLLVQALTSRNKPCRYQVGPQKDGHEATTVTLPDNKFFQLHKHAFVHLEFPPSELQIEYLKKIQDFVQTKGGVFIINFVPLHSHQVNAMRNNPKQGPYEKAFLESLKRALSADTWVVGSYNFPEISNQKKYYFDPVHLNFEGSALYTQKLGVEVKSILETQQCHNGIHCGKLGDLKDLYDATQ